MYVFKNALRCISRSKGRNLLIGIIVLVIALSACVGLSIRQAAEDARADAMEGMSVTATISFDRRSAMEDMGTPPEQPQEGEMSEGGFDRSQFAQMMGESSALTLEEYEKYAAADSVKDFYYTLTVSVNGNDGLEPVTSDTDSDSDDTAQTQPDGFGGMGGGMDRVMGAQSDFTVVGYSSEDAMTAFNENTASITDGDVFSEGGTDYDCIISEELATFNDLEVGDTVDITNPNNEDEVYTLTVCGIYLDSSANENSFSMMGMTSNDPANRIYMSSAALQHIIDASDEVSTTLTDEDTGREFETALTGELAGTYTFADVEAYEKFEEQVRDMGLDESYTVSSSDITAFESRLAPLETLSKTAGYFLVVILVIGAVILVVLGIFNVRERKYEIGVLTAMGMKKGKVAMQFLTEIFVVTMAAVIIGAGIGAVSSVPVTNALLKSQAEAQQTQAEDIEQNFGRGPMGDAAGIAEGQAPGMTEGDRGQNKGGFMGIPGGEQVADYVTEISAATNMTVLLQMLGIAVLLTIISGAVSVLFIMRYEPLRILSNRD